jgi:hypothetical protein
MISVLVFGHVPERGNEMPRVTRRAVLKSSSIIACAAATGVVDSAGEATAQAPPANFFHVFAFQWKPGTTPAQIDQARKEILAFQGVIPGLMQTHVGPNLSTKGKGYSFGGVMEFVDQASFNAYPEHPAHQALLKWLVPLIDPIELDLKA